MQASIAAHGYTPILLPPHPALPTPIASHPDMLLFFAPDGIYTSKIYAEVAKNALEIITQITGRPVLVCDAELDGGYETEVFYNVAPIGSRLFCHSTLTAKEITSRTDCKICATRQGYAKCSVIPIDDYSMITADPSIAKAAEREGVEVLLLESQGCYLDGYSTGFIGGACSYSPYHTSEEIFFCGNLNSHPQAAKIIDFCKLHGRIPISLSSSPLCDLGTIFLI